MDKIKTGSIFVDNLEDRYILSFVDFNNTQKKAQFALINLENGNRFSKPQWIDWSQVHRNYLEVSVSLDWIKENLFSDDILELLENP